jgi:hypothetical protein
MKVNKMENEHNSYSNKFDFFVSGFISIFSLSLAIYAIYVSGGVKAMNQPLPLLVWIGIIIAGVFCLFAIYYGIKMVNTPRDTRLDDLILVVNDLKPKDKIPNAEDIQNRLDKLTDSINELAKEIRKDREKNQKKATTTPQINR